MSMISCHAVQTTKGAPGQEVDLNNGKYKMKFYVSSKVWERINTLCNSHSREWNGMKGPYYNTRIRIAHPESTQPLIIIPFNGGILKILTYEEVASRVYERGKKYWVKIDEVPEG